MLAACVIRRSLGLIAMLAILLGSATNACEFCAAPALTLSEQIANSQIALLVDWQSGREADFGDAGSASFTIRQVVAGPNADWDVGQELQQAGHVAASKGEQFLLLGQVYEREISWQPHVRMPAEVFEYVRKAPANTEPLKVRLAYYLQHLEHKNVDISNDAFGEFAKAPYEDIRLLSKLFSPELLRKWLAAEGGDRTRCGLYGLMLGLCGSQQDAQFLLAQILRPSAEFRLGSDGLMAGYLLLSGDRGLQELTQTKLKEGNETELHALMKALRFHANYHSAQLSQQALNASMRQMLSNSNLAELAIIDLARWNDWEAMDLVVQVYDNPASNHRSAKLMVVRYFLTAETVSDEEITAVQRQHAASLLKSLETRDSKLVSEARRQLF